MPARRFGAAPLTCFFALAAGPLAGPAAWAQDVAIHEKWEVDVHVGAIAPSAGAGGKSIAEWPSSPLRSPASIPHRTRK